MAKLATVVLVACLGGGCDGAPAPVSRPPVASGTCPQGQELLAAVARLRDLGRLDSALARLRQVPELCAGEPKLLAVQMALLVELGDIAAAQQVARTLVAQAPERQDAELAQAVLQRAEPVDALAGTQQLWTEGLKALGRGEAVAARRSLDRALHALERIAGARAVPEAFTEAELVEWGPRVAYWSVRSNTAVAASAERSIGEPYLVRTEVDRAARRLVPVESWKGNARASARSARDLVLGGGDGLLLYRGWSRPPKRLAGRSAVFSPDGTRLLVFDEQRVDLVDPASLDKTSIALEGDVVPFAGALPAGVFLAEGGTFVAAGLSPLVLDLQAGRAVLHRRAEVSALSPSKRYLAAISLEFVQPKMHRVVRVWKLAELHKAPVQTDLGPFRVEVGALQFDQTERHVAVVDQGPGGGRGGWTPQTTCMRIATGAVVRCPAAGAMAAADPSAQWQALRSSFVGLAKPQQLVATRRVAGGFLSFAEVPDGTSVALLAGQVDDSKAFIQAVSAPSVLLVEARTGRLLRRREIPLQTPTRAFTGGALWFAPNGKRLLVCLEGSPQGGAGDPQSVIWDAESQQFTRVRASPDACLRWSFSADSSTLLAPALAYDIASGSPYALPFAPEDRVAAALSRLPLQSGQAPPWLLCRVGPLLAPFEACRQRFADELESGPQEERARDRWPQATTPAQRRQSE